MKIEIDTIYLQDLVYRMLRDLDDGVYKNTNAICRGLLDTEKTLALETLINRLEGEAK